MAVNRELVTSQILDYIDIKKCSERQALKEIAKKYKITNWKIRGAIHALTFEVIRKTNAIDEIIKYVLTDKKIFNQIEPSLKNLLRIGVYEIKYQRKVPAQITNEIVEIVKEKFGSSQANFTNALLKKIELISLKEIENSLPEIKRLSFKYYHPTWYIDYLQKILDKESTIALLTENNKVPPLYIRVNTLKIPITTLIEILKDQKIEVEQDSDFPEILKIKKTKIPITRIKSYQKGLFYIQTKASAIVTHVLDPQLNELIYDMCSAPGGKTTHIAQLMKNTGTIVAIDYSHRRLKELKSKLRILNIKNIHILIADSKNPPLRIKADRVLVDPPCTGSGAYGSRPLSRWKVNIRSLETYTNLQWRLLNKGAEYVKKGGILVYSTCSVLIEENEQIINKFLNKFQNFKLVPALPNVGIKGFMNCTNCKRLFPHLHSTEGFFIAKFQKINES
ncbi:MAG: RsmB/NOP family class I SAM-dependent RNA methyltransferase [Candidatus Helarchaeota archaeon]